MASSLYWLQFILKAFDTFKLKGILSRLEISKMRAAMPGLSITCMSGGVTNEEFPTLNFDLHYAFNKPIWSGVTPK